MASNQSSEIVVSSSTWPAKQVYALAAGFLIVGLGIGYFLLGTKIFPTTPVQAKSPVTPPVPGVTAGAHPMPTMDQMKQMAAVQTSALVEKLKTDPKNTALLIQVASIYKTFHQFKEASGYYDQALKTDPNNVSAHTELASCLYYSGDVDGAIGQLKQSLKYSPTDANSLFNLGVIKWKGKNDAAGAIATWQELLKTNPNLDRRPIVEQLIAEAQAESRTAK